VAEYLKQTPVLAVCLGVVYLAWRYTQALHNRYLESLEKSHADHLPSKAAEIQRLTAESEAARKEREKLLKQITAGRDKT
jgi:gamma-glutamyl-gamma-aminobutyrate hydrolase PuuD